MSDVQHSVGREILVVFNCFDNSVLDHQNCIYHRYIVVFYGSSLILGSVVILRMHYLSLFRKFTRDIFLAILKHIWKRCLLSLILISGYILWHCIIM